MKVTDVTSCIVPITLQLRDKTHSKLSSLSGTRPLFIVLTVPDEAPFSPGTDTAHPARTSTAAVFHPALPACSQIDHRPLKRWIFAGPRSIPCSNQRGRVHKMRTAGLLLLVGLCALNAALALKICAFNVKSFGESKANNKKVMGILLKILSRCDLCLVQEVRDSKGEAIQNLVKGLNRFDELNSYSYVESERLGRRSYKEQYVYVYRDNMLKVKDHYQHPKLEAVGTNDTNVFSREPFIVRFHSPTTLVKDLVLIGQHTCPRTAMKEMDELYTVFRAVSKKWKTDNVIILGDLNAGCSYVTIKGWRVVRLRSDPKFHWLIGDDEDTTVREKTHCAYDRIIVHGREIISTVVPGSAQPFNFKENFHLTEEEALEVSDHFPVEVDLKPSHRYLLRHEL
ncbi:deoxyribonuclease I-like 1-like [Aulostomus maculatus]